jgi:hypothetical protein
MKKLIFSLVISIAFAACQGPMGPPGPVGPQGPQGQSGVNIVGITDEIVFNFSRSTFDFFYEFPAAYRNQVLESDVVLTYFLWEINNGTDIWRPLPMTIFFGQDILMYAYDFTFQDVMFYMDGNFPLQELPDTWFNNWVARIVIVPSDFFVMAERDGVDFTNFEQTSRYFNVDFPKLIEYTDEMTAGARMSIINE